MPSRQELARRSASRRHQHPAGPEAADDGLKIEFALDGAPRSEMVEVRDFGRPVMCSRFYVYT